jgi:hypothetical protein
MESTPSVIVFPSLDFAAKTMSEYEELGSRRSVRVIRTRLSFVVSFRVEATATLEASFVRVIRTLTGSFESERVKSRATVRSSTTLTPDIANPAAEAEEKAERESKST